MFFILCWTFFIIQETFHGGECFHPPDFRSDWLLIQAQGNEASIINAAHGLGVVPHLVEVLVKVIDGDNKDFIFKAMGSAGKDDDYNHVYGKVVYFYNKHVVKVMAPNGNNDYTTGGAIYTGESPAWRGVNTQFSQTAYIQVRCWTSSSLPSSCFHSTGTIIQSGSAAGTNSYVEISHGLGQYPEMLKVRANLTVGNLEGWFCDGQGSVTGQYSVSPNYSYQTSSGMHFGYDSNTMRVWASSHGTDNLCESDDGYFENILVASGELDVVAWCDLDLPVTNRISVELTATTSIDDLSIQLPKPLVEIDKVLFSFMIGINSGPNAGFLFEGSGSASSNIYNINTSPCDYGGIIYAYSDRTVRMWMPNPETEGAAVCVSEGYGGGQNAQATNDVTVFITTREWDLLKSVKDCTSGSQATGSVPCGKFNRMGSDMAYNGTVLDQQDSSAISDCGRKCVRIDTCTAFALKDQVCKMYESFDPELLMADQGSEVWLIQM